MPQGARAATHFGARSRLEVSVRVRPMSTPMIVLNGKADSRVLHITRVQGSLDPVNAEYQIVFAPLGGRLRIRHALCQGLDGPTDFLRQARVPLPEIERTWQNLAKRRICSVPRVALTRVQMEALGL